MDSKALDQELKKVLAIIFKQDTYSKKEADEISAQVVQYWRETINPGFLDYRKSVADDFAAVEWKDGTPGGSVFTSLHGNDYIDCLGGFGIYNCGHRHPKILAAVQAQLQKQALHSQELLDPLRAYCGHLLRLIAPKGLQYSFFTNSGTESVEACLKFAILATKRHHFLATTGSFHGKTLGALSTTSKSAFRAPFGPALMNVSHVPPNCITTLEAAFKSSVFAGNHLAGFIVEPVQGEGGIHIMTNEYLQAARRLCTEHGVMLIFDEVQSGMGRTGTWWGCDHAGVSPDIMALGKSFGGGVMPAGACMATEKVWQAYIEEPFIMTTTFGGNPLAMAAAIATIDVINSEGLVNAAKTKGAYFLEKLRALQAEFPQLIREVRGLGLMIGIDFQTNELGWEFSKGTFKRGVLVSGTLVNAKVVRVEPPLTIEIAQIDQVISVMKETLHQLAGAKI